MIDGILKSFSSKELIKELKTLCRDTKEPYDYKNRDYYNALNFELIKRGYEIEVTKKIKLIKKRIEITK